VMFVSVVEAGSTRGEMNREAYAQVMGQKLAGHLPHPS
jgi:hypothetical protein